MIAYFGIDWGEESHELCVTNEKGEQIVRQALKQTIAGFENMERVRQQLKLSRSECIIGIESAHTILIDWMWAQGYEQIYVLPPHTVEKSRERFRQSGSKSDKIDAYEISELLRTVRHRLHSWHPGSSLLQQLRASASWHLALNKQLVAQSNRLRDLLLRYYPAAFHAFSSWPTQSACHLVINYPSPAMAQSLSFADFRQLLKAQGMARKTQLLQAFDRYQATYPAARAAVVAAYQPQAVSLAQMVLTTIRQQNENQRLLNQDFAQHPDAALFASLPGVGEWLAPALLVKFGEDRKRFPTAALLQAVAGTAPVTQQSGKHRTIFFRRGCNHEFRLITQQWARASCSQSAWAHAYFQQVFARSRSENHAYRCLANRWLAIAWRLWQDGRPYDEDLHLQKRAARRLPPVRH